MREETFRAALGSLTDAILAKPLSGWFGKEWRASADGQAFALGGPGEGSGLVNAHYGRDPVIKIYTTVTGRDASAHQTVMAGEAIHALDGIYDHASSADLSTLHVDGGGVSDMVFAVMHLLGLSSEPRIPRLSDRHLYSLERSRRYGRLAPLFGQQLQPRPDRQRLGQDRSGRVRYARQDGYSVPHPQEALRLPLAELALRRPARSRAHRAHTLTLRWYQEPDPRRLVTAELNKGEVRNSMARAVAFHRLGRFRDRRPENQHTRAAALTPVTVAIILFNCRHLGRALDVLQRCAGPIDDDLIARLSPLGWDRINLTGDYYVCPTPANSTSTDSCRSRSIKPHRPRNATVNPCAENALESSCPMAYLFTSALARLVTAPRRSSYPTVPGAPLLPSKGNRTGSVLEIARMYVFDVRQIGRANVFLISSRSTLERIS